MLPRYKAESSSTRGTGVEFLMTQRSIKTTCEVHEKLKSGYRCTNYLILSLARASQIV